MNIPAAFFRLWLFSCLFMLSVPGERAAAGPLPCQPDEPCKVVDGDYLLRFPPDWDGQSPLKTLIFFHGHNSSAITTHKSATLRRDFARHGYLVIAPNGARRTPDRPRGWPAIAGLEGVRDDLAFVDQVMADVMQRVPLDRSRTLVAGFSSGGSMAWYLACYRGDEFSAFVSIAGGLRDPHPPGICARGPVRMLHIHGFTDPTVPLEGRAIGRWHQGDVFASLDLLRRTDGCRSQPDRFTADETYRCRNWESCESGRDIRFCLHDGGHMLPAGWAVMAREWFESGAVN